MDSIGDLCVFTGSGQSFHAFAVLSGCGSAVKRDELRIQQSPVGTIFFLSIKGLLIWVEVKSAGDAHNRNRITP